MGHAVSANSCFGGQNPGKKFGAKRWFGGGSKLAIEPWCYRSALDKA